MDLGILLPLAAFVILVVLFVIVLRRASIVFADTRRAVTFRQAVAEIEDRVDGDLADLAGMVGPLRSGSAQLPPEDAFSDAMSRTTSTIDWARTRVKGLVTPLGLEDAGDAYLEELGQADEALRSLEHGYAILSTARVDPRALEGRTAIKRGFLSIVHVREGLGLVAARVATSRSQGEQGLIGRQRAPGDHRM